MSERLDEILAEAKRDAEGLRRHGDAKHAASIETLAERVARCEELQLLAWVSETDALTRSGHGEKWFRARRAAWKEAGLARRGHRGRWEYRACVVPRADRVDDQPSRLDRILEELAS